MKKTTNKKLGFVITFSAILIAGSMTFLGFQIASMNKTPEPEENPADLQAEKAADLQAEIQKGIDEYVKKQKAEAPSAKPAKKPEIVAGNHSDDDPFMGDKNAPVTLIEWSDYECPFCKRFFDNTLHKIKTKYIDTGKVKFVYRDFPLSFHANAMPAAIAAECAREQGGDETYFKYHDMIFEKQSLLNTSNFKKFADNLGLNTDKFNECFDGRKYKDEVDKDFRDGQSVGVTGTPGFLLNGRLISGAQPYSVFEAAIEAELQQ